MCHPANPDKPEKIATKTQRETFGKYLFLCLGGEDVLPKNAHVSQLRA